MENIALLFDYSNFTSELLYTLNLWVVISEAMQICKIPTARLRPWEGVVE